jgi:hypothetical protein
MIGGGGKRILGLAAREADIVNFGPRQPKEGRVDVASYLLPALEEQVGWVREAAGQRFADLELCTYNSWTVANPIITDHALREAEEQAAGVSQRTGYPLTADELIEAPHAYIGSVDFLRGQDPWPARAARDQLLPSSTALTTSPWPRSSRGSAGT